MDYVITMISDVSSFTCILVIFFFLFEWRIKRSKTLTAFLVFGLLCSVIYLAACSVFHDMIGYSSISLICFTLPTLIFNFLMAKYRDMRFLFTYCAIDVVAFSINLVARGIAVIADNSAWVVLLFTLLMDGLAVAAVLRIQKEYLEILKMMQKRWGLLALTSVSMYAMLYFMTIYPKPLYQRIEYIPILIAFCGIALLVYVVIYSTISTTMKYYKNVERQKDLEAELKTKEVYEKLAYIDAMTGLGNRRSFEKHLCEMEEKKLPICYLALDINNLKIINDTYGHHKGDEIICACAEIIRRYERGIMIGYRIGGDEFALVSTGMDMNGIDSLIHELETDMERQKNTIRIAMGYDWLRDYKNDSVRELLVRSDRKMYIQKQRMKETGDLKMQL